MSTPLHISGRGKLTASANTREDGITIRIDDTKNPEFWAEVRLSCEVMRELLNWCYLLEGEDGE